MESGHGYAIRNLLTGFARARSARAQRIHVATVEGFPELKDVMHRIEQKQYRKVALLPFMFVAGDHAKNDMAGDEDSWKCELEEAGYEVRPILRGLGELPGIRQIFMEHLEEAQ